MVFKRKLKKMSEKKFNKAAKIREMIAANPEVKFSEVEAEFKKLGENVAAAQFYTLKKKESGTDSAAKGRTAKPKSAVKEGKIKIRRKKSEDNTHAPVVRVTSVAAKASSTTAFEPQELLTARRNISKAIRNAYAQFGREDVVQQLVTDVMAEVSRS